MFFYVLECSTFISLDPRMPRMIQTLDLQEESTVFDQQ